MNKEGSIVSSVTEGKTVLEDGFQIVAGQWYWVTGTHSVYNEDTETHEQKSYRWLGCVMHIGSNFVELEEPSTPNCGTHHVRVHFNECHEILEFVSNHEEMISDKIQHFQKEAVKHLNEIKRLTSRLGVSPGGAIAHQKDAPHSSQALMVLSEAPDVKQYQKDLVLAKEKQLPELFDAVEDANNEVIRWMKATALPLLAQTNGMKGVIDEIEDRIFNVNIYAGLTETVVQCCEGSPALFTEKLHVMQRRLYIDEECLLNYEHGGMEFSDIAQFDEWISKPVNRDRILPYPRTIVAMRVRRFTKDRDEDGSLTTMLINIHLAQDDKLTFLYIRNGERVYRLSCDLDFGQLLVPDRSEFDPSERMMVKLFGNRVDRLIRRDEYDHLLKNHLDSEEKSAQWDKDNPKETWDEKEKGWRSNPYDHHRLNFDPKDWQPYDPSSVFFDDATDTIKESIKQYNRIALVIQGLFDRSDVLHPHPPVRVWNPESFSASIELVYDGSNVLEHGEPPDFDAYRVACNASLDANSVVIGQQEEFIRRATEKENNRIRNDWRNRNKFYVTRFKPYGNPGPGELAKMAKWKPRSRQATFIWTRRGQSMKRYDERLTASITVSADNLFNASAYKKGEYLQFFADHRTRAQYFKWAPLLLMAEEYVVGNKIPREPESGEENE